MISLPSTPVPLFRLAPTAVPVGAKRGPFTANANGALVLNTRLTFYPDSNPSHARLVAMLEAAHQHRLVNHAEGAATLIVSLLGLAIEGGQLETTAQPAPSAAEEPVDLSGLGDGEL